MLVQHCNSKRSMPTNKNVIILVRRGCALIMLEHQRHGLRSREGASLRKYHFNGGSDHATLHLYALGDSYNMFARNPSDTECNRCCLGLLRTKPGLSTTKERQHEVCCERWRSTNFYLHLLRLYDPHPCICTFVSHAPLPLITISPSTSHSSAPKNGGTWPYVSV